MKTSQQIKNEVEKISEKKFGKMFISFKDKIDKVGLNENNEGFNTDEAIKLFELYLKLK